MSSTLCSFLSFGSLSLHSSFYHILHQTFVSQNMPNPPFLLSLNGIQNFQVCLTNSTQDFIISNLVSVMLSCIIVGICPDQARRFQKL